MLTASIYRQWRDHGRARNAQRRGPRPVALAEAVEPYPSLAVTERLVQALWYDQRLRAESLRTTDGRAVKVLSPGFWNLEAGPDFRRALIQFDANPPQLGDVEIHLSAPDWTRHGHQHDPHYNNVLLHVVLWESGSEHRAQNSQHQTLPQLVMHPCLDAPLTELCEAIDPAAYPYSDQLHTGTCAQTLLHMSLPAREALLDAAGEERLQAKARKFVRWAEASNFNQALYEGVMEALGYKANKSPFRLLAQRLPLATLPTDPLTLQATFLGVAGFLPKTTDRHWDPASRKQAKALWDRWWKIQAGHEDSMLDVKLWRFAGLRPQNYPQRRLAAMSLLLTQPRSLSDQFQTVVTHGNDPKKTIATLENLFSSLDDPFWSRHYHFGSVAKAPIALLGRARARDILVNVVLPFLVAQPHTPPSLRHQALALYSSFPRLAPNSVEKFAAYRFFGPEANVTQILSTARRQQGLLQLFQDFCLNDSSACAHCELPHLLAHWQK